MEELNTIKEITREVMRTDSKTRNSDKWLILQVLRKMGFNIYVDYSQLQDMPSFESITRARRFIQNNDKELLPTQQTDDRRNARQEEFREVFR